MKLWFEIPSTGATFSGVVVVLTRDPSEAGATLNRFALINR
jgi:hypothetical protein